jgi:hypothetical protein
VKILIRSGGRWEPVEAKVYDDEGEFQRLLKDSPEVIPSDPERPSAPIAWCREFPTAAGPIDLVGLGADGSITIMECKLARNQEIRRKVVGQVLDYAAALWKRSVEDVEEQFGRIEGETPFDRLRQDADADPEWDADVWRQEIGDRLATGSFRLLIAVDELDENLKRIIRYVNAQGTGERRLKLVALAFPRYFHSIAEILVPETYGDEAGAVAVSSAGGNPGIPWTAERFFPMLSEADRVVALKLFDWIEASPARVYWGRGGVGGSFSAHLDANGTWNSLFSVDTAGKVWLKFGDMKRRSPFDDRGLRLELANRLRAIEGIDFQDDRVERFPNFPLDVLSRADSFKSFTDAMEWAIGEFRRYETKQGQATQPAGLAN